MPIRIPELHILQLAGLLFPLLIGFGPLCFLLYKLSQNRKKYHDRASDPFAEFPLRPPGESLRIKLEKLEEEYLDHATSLAAASAITAAFLCAIGERAALIAWIVVALALVGYYLHTAPKLLLLIEEIRNHRLGFMGERIVGETLNQLLTQGYQVFHDVPFERYNIDHVIVGPSGVYAVETKTRRKPADVPSDERAVVEFDGAALHFPKFRDEASLLQARRNAKSLSTLLTNALGELVVVQAILTLPGWYVHRRAKSDVNVLNPTEIARSFPRNPKFPLTPIQVRRIAYHLSQLCRIKAETEPRPSKLGLHSTRRSRVPANATGT